MPFLDFLPLIGDALGAIAGHSAQQSANRTNLKNAREQREWEANMANTAVQRRRKDIEAAGFNPVLAATGVGASTPSVSPAPAEPTFKPEWTKGAGASALLLKEQLLNMRANTAATAADARVKNVEAKIREALIGQETEYRANKFVEAREWDDLRTEILRSQNITNASEAKKWRESVDALISATKTQAEKGKIELDNLKSLIESFGLGASEKATLIQKLMTIILPMVTTGAR